MGTTENVNKQWPLAAVVSALLAGTLGFVLLSTFPNVAPAGVVPDTYIAQMGNALVSHQGYLLPFEVASVRQAAAQTQPQMAPGLSAAI